MKLFYKLGVELEGIVARGVGDSQGFEEQHRHEGILLTARFALQPRTPPADEELVVKLLKAPVQLAPLGRHLDHC